MCDLGLHFVAKSNYFSNTQTSHTRPIVDGVRSSVAYSTNVNPPTAFTMPIDVCKHYIRREAWESCSPLHSLAHCSVLWYT